MLKRLELGAPRSWGRSFCWDCHCWGQRTLCIRWRRAWLRRSCRKRSAFPQVSRDAHTTAAALPILSGVDAAVVLSLSILFDMMRQDAYFSMLARTSRKLRSVPRVALYENNFLRMGTCKDASREPSAKRVRFVSFSASRRRQLRSIRRQCRLPYSQLRSEERGPILCFALICAFKLRHLVL